MAETTKKTKSSKNKSETKSSKKDEKKLKIEKETAKILKNADKKEKKEVKIHKEVEEKKPVEKVILKESKKVVEKKPVEKVVFKDPKKVEQKKIIENPAEKLIVKTGKKVEEKKHEEKVVFKSSKKIVNNEILEEFKNKWKVSNNNKKLPAFVKKFDYIKNNFLDVFLIYKNFLHWNVSKLIIFVWSTIVLWFISVVPLIIILYVYSIFTWVDIIKLIDWDISWNLAFNLIGYFFLFVIISVYFIFFSYSNVLLMKINNYYLEWKKLPYKENDYLNIKKIIKFFNLSLLNILILLIPVLIFLISIGLLILISGGIANANQIVSTWINNYLSISGLISLVLSSLLLVYLYYRVVFSYFILSDDNYYDENKTALSYIRESFNKTKKVKNLFKYISIFIIYVILVSPISYLDQKLEKRSIDFKNYFTYLNFSEEEKNNISQEDIYYVESLKLNYGTLTADEIGKEINKNSIYYVLYTILDFIFLYWLFIMVTSSFYRRELV